MLLCVFLDFVPLRWFLCIWWVNFFYQLHKVAFTVKDFLLAMCSRMLFGKDRLALAPGMHSLVKTMQLLHL